MYLTPQQRGKRCSLVEISSACYTRRMTTHWLSRVLSVFGVSSPMPAPVIVPGVEFHDRRKQAAQSHHGYPVRRRKLSSVTGICLHQTACLMGERPARYDGTGAHVIVTRNGRVIWLHDFDRRVVAANGWNNGTVSIEIDGLYAGVDGDLRTVWDDPSTPHREMPVALTTEATRAALQVIEWIREHVPSVRVIVAHRQASSDRRNDPGEEIWKAVALQCGLLVAPLTTLDDGLPIPEMWDGQSIGVRY